MELSIANAYVVYGTRPILIDSGPANSADDLARGLREMGIAPGSLALVILTHGHADHAGGARRVHDEWHTPVLVGGGDASMVRAGHNRPLRPTSITARLIRPFVDDPFNGFEPDLGLIDHLDLRPYGVEGEVISTPGHTPGSLVVLLANGDAFVGDLFAAGYLGGALFPHSPGTHYFHDDRAAAERQICAMIRRGARRLFLGHGGPVSADDAWARFCNGQPRS